ncbi:MAG: translocation/assembly module TamB domain-containing protein [Acetobacteraceae bacterium]|nr:translocation/assembly module TamB domain-containing protein [Acetobacteraceae bacterium]
MRRAPRVLGWIAGGLLLLPVLLVGGVLAVANTSWGQRLIEAQLPKLTGGTVAIDGLSGRVPDRLRAARIEVRDKDGAWLTIEQLSLDWHPLRLLSKTADLSLLSAAHVDLARLPVSEPAAQAQPSSSSGFSLPVTVELGRLQVARLDLGRPVAGEAAAFAADGHGRLVSLDEGAVALALRRLDGEGSYELNGRLDPASVAATLKAREPAHGFVGTLAALPDLGPLSIDATLDGPRDAVATTLAVDAGPLTARVNGTVDLVHEGADGTVQANAPAMSPRPDLSWRSVALNARLHGPFTAPEADGTLAIAALKAAGASIDRIDARVGGNAGRVALHAEANGIALPGPKPDALGTAPVVVDSTIQLDLPARPLTLSIRHPLVIADGTADTGGALTAHSTVDLPDLGKLAAIGGVDLQGHTKLDLAVHQEGEATAFTANGTLGITGGMAPVPALIGDAGTLDLAGTLNGQNVAVSRFALDGKTLAVTASGGLRSTVADVTLHTQLKDLHALAPTLAGSMNVDAHLAGPLDDFGVDADLAGTVASGGVPSGPLKARLEAQHLPKAPSGTLTAQGTLDGAPVDVDVNARQDADAMQVDISRADWKSAHAAGSLTLPHGASVPLGKLDIGMARLDDLRALTGQKLTGAVTASLQTAEKDGRQTATLKAEAREAGITGTATVGRATLGATVLDPVAKPVLDAKLAAEDIAAAGLAASTRADLSGPLDALGVKLTAGVQDLQGAPLTVTAGATVDVPGQRTTLSALQADWKGQALRLLQPARVTYGSEVSVDRLRLGMQQATIDVAGRISPALDLTAAIRNVTPDLAKVVVPDLSAEGTLQADAKLTGTTARPAGTVRIAANGLHMRTGPASSLPPATITANAELRGESADIDARLNAGRATTLTVTGRAPIQPATGPLDLRAAGAFDLALLNPLLEAGGRRAQGRLTLDARIAGTVASPQISGNAQLANGEVQDFGLGARIRNINGLVQADGTTIRIARFDGQAGRGTLGLTGTVSPTAPGMPVDLRFVARDAEPLASDRLTVTLGADVTLRGEIENQLAAAGRVTISHAEIRVPEHMPASIVVLAVHKPGEKPPAPSSAPDIALDLTINAPAQIFVRGRGIFAELGGAITVKGTAAAPEPEGAFKLIRGTVSVAGQSLTFSKGEVTFNGGKISDPSILFVATSSNSSMTANLEISGTASAPKIRLYSTPEYPQDEVLAQLIFKRSASTLSPLELAQLAGALAELTGVGGGGSFNPLETVRKGLGLDTLSVGGGTGNSGPTVQGGRYVAPGVFVGAKQGTGGNSTQGLVQVDLYKGLKLQGTVGTGANTTPGASPEDSAGSSVGLKYQFEY